MYDTGLGTTADDIGAKDISLDLSGVKTSKKKEKPFNMDVYRKFGEKPSPKGLNDSRKLSLVSSSSSSHSLESKTTTIVTN
jgi:hypothetical protein